MPYDVQAFAVTYDCSDSSPLVQGCITIGATAAMLRSQFGFLADCTVCNVHPLRLMPAELTFIWLLTVLLPKLACDQPVVSFCDLAACLKRPSLLRSCAVTISA